MKSDDSEAATFQWITSDQVTGIRRLHKNVRNKCMHTPTYFQLPWQLKTQVPLDIVRIMIFMYFGPDFTKNFFLHIFLEWCILSFSVNKDNCAYIHDMCSLMLESFLWHPLVTSEQQNWHFHNIRKHKEKYYILI